MILLFAIVASSTFIATWVGLRAIERRMMYRATLNYHLNKLMENDNV